MKYPRCPSDLPFREPRLEITIVFPMRLLDWDLCVVLEGKPPVGVYQQRFSPFVVCLLHPDVVIEPVIRRRTVQRFATRLVRHNNEE